MKEPPSPTADYTQNELLFCQPYATKFDWEDREHMDDEEFYSSDEEVLPNTFETVKRFLREVRESKGYDVDCCPPFRLGSPFFTMPGFTKNERVMKSAELAIEKINADTAGTTYKLVNIEKAIWTSHRIYLLTLTAKEVVTDAEEAVADAHDAAKDVGTDVDNDCNAAVKTFRAMVYLPHLPNYEVLEWKFKQ